MTSRFYVSLSTLKKVLSKSRFLETRRYEIDYNNVFKKIDTMECNYYLLVAS